MTAAALDDDSAPAPVTLERVAAVLSAHLPVYAVRAPVYQTAMLQALRRLWDPSHRRVLDVGGGTGVIAQAVREMFPVDEVVSVDVEDRYLPSLTIAHATYDGAALPFADCAFDAAMVNNVLHHVPPAARPALLREVRRVTGAGPLYIKDHLARGPLDRARLTVLDWIGNIPFGGMLSADYLTGADWDALAREAGYAADAQVSGRYRAGPFAAAFPNRLELTLRWRPLAG